MRYIMREKLFSIGGDAMIKDDSGQDRYFVDGKAIAILRKLVMKDMEGNEVATIQRAIAIRPTFEITYRGELLARVVKTFLTFIVDRFKIDLPGPVDLEAHGDLLHHEYNITRQDREVARITKAWISLTDAYGIDIASGENDVLLLAVAVAIDEIVDRESD